MNNLEIIIIKLCWSDDRSIEKICSVLEKFGFGHDYYYVTRICSKLFKRCFLKKKKLGRKIYYKTDAYGKEFLLSGNIDTEKRDDYNNKRQLRVIDCIVSNAT